MDRHKRKKTQTGTLRKHARPIPLESIYIQLFFSLQTHTMTRGVSGGGGGGGGGGDGGGGAGHTSPPEHFPLHHLEQKYNAPHPHKYKITHSSPFQ